MTCDDDNILGVFPKIDGMDCNNYAIMIAFIAIASALIFWGQVTK